MLAPVAFSSQRLTPHFKEPLEYLAEARTSPKVDPAEADQAFQTLATRSSFLLLKGGLVLTG